MPRVKTLSLFCLLCVFGAAAWPQGSQDSGKYEPERSNGRHLEAVAMRLVDDKIEVEAWVATLGATGQSSRKALSARDPILWTIEKGDGQLYEDPGTGRMLFEPTGTEALVVRPRMGDLVGQPITIGLSPNTLGEELEAARSFVAAGGGVCGNRTGPRMFDDPVDVRSVVASTVIPVSPTQRVVRYAFGDYYSFHPTVGTMRIQYNPDQTSEVRLTSLSPEGKPFFPAVAEGDLYFVIETLKDGWTIFNKEPMTVHATVLKWPPFETPVINDRGVRFYSKDRPDVEVHRIAYQELYVYPSREIEVKTLSFSTENDQLDAAFELRNRSKNPGDIRWFVIGDINESLSEPQGVVHLEAGEATKVEYRAKIRPSALPQFITLGAVSESGARLVGFEKVDFRVPGPELVNQSQKKLSR